MNKRGLIARTAAGALGGMLLIGVAGAAIADELGSDEVDVNVNIEALEPVGALTMSVAQGSTSLTEVASTDPTLRQFDGTLPTVTITDDREETPADQYWYVTGQSSSFTAAGVPDIGAGNIGWVPALLSGDDEQVLPGDEIVTVLDDPTFGTPGTPSANNVGLVGEELLAFAPNLTGELAPGEWTANAQLFLKTPVTVAPGNYSATITLTLWEDAI
ncbi:hypothetical protein [Microbacterium allomyrinae]|uniref:WxL domain-containing protein n=1 Tax=Microbacterium allomyrinae TaxID=2830666 RepID=A0A9X1LT34_9MICO|nr:hypothetical protein [Microbacterium allomyrinae]MCC2031464.1 hypothetical protein [Microbacterium allomyrinae]